MLAGTSSKVTGPHRISIAVQNYMRTEDALYCTQFPVVHGVLVYGDVGLCQGKVIRIHTLIRSTSNC